MSLPDSQSIWYTDKCIEKVDLTVGILVTDLHPCRRHLHALPILIEGHNCDAKVLFDGHLHIQPFIQGQIDRL